MAASTTSHGWRVERKIAAEATMSADWAIRATRGLQRSAGQRIAKVMAVLARSVSVTATPNSVASRPSRLK
jgi:hypothetical protein